MAEIGSDSAFLIPNAVWGSYASASGPPGYDPKRLRARSPSFGDALKYRMILACKGFGEHSKLPSRGALMQVPSHVLPARGTGSGEFEIPRRGVLVVAIQLLGLDHHQRGGARGFRALFLPEDIFAAFDDQTFGLWSQGAVPPPVEWDGKEDVPLVRLTRGQAQPPPLPALRPAQVEVLVAELRHVLKGGDVAYPIVHPSQASDEHLRILQLGLPRELRLGLGFATTLGSPGLHQPTNRGGERFAICAYPGLKEFEPGAHQLVHGSRRPAAPDAAIEAYVGEYAARLKTGDLAGLLRLTRVGLPVEPARGDAGAEKKGLFSWFRR